MAPRPHPHLHGNRLPRDDHHLLGGWISRAPRHRLRCRSPVDDVPARRDCRPRDGGDGYRTGFGNLVHRPTDTSPRLPQPSYGPDQRGVGADGPGGDHRVRFRHLVVGNRGRRLQEQPLHRQPPVSHLQGEHTGSRARSHTRRRRRYLPIQAAG